MHPSFSRIVTGEAELLDILRTVMGMGSVLVDGEDRIIRNNEKFGEIYSVPVRQMEGRRLTDIPNSEELCATLRTVRSSGHAQVNDIKLPPPLTLGHVTGLPYRPHRFAPANSVLLLIRDISRLWRLEQAGKEYASNVSHELKTPLTVILGYAETMRAHPEMSVDDRDKALDKITANTQRITTIVNDLLHLAWLSSELQAHSQLARPRVRVIDVVEKAVEACRPWAEKANIDVEVKIPHALQWALHPGLISEAITNLIKNALLYSVVGPVRVQARINPRIYRLEISVIDQGIGMTPSDAARIFDRFYRVDKSRSRSTGGSGLGLPIVQQIVKAHNGTTWVDSKPGKGSTFTLNIPPASPHELP